MSTIIKSDIKGMFIPVELSTGVTIPFRETRSKKSGNRYFAVLKERINGTLYDPGFYGQKVVPAVVGGSLPKSVTCAGTKIGAVPGKTTSGNPKVSFHGRVTNEGEDRILDLSISRLPNGDFNIAGSLHLPGGAAKVATAL